MTAVSQVVMENTVFHNSQRVPHSTLNNAIHFTALNCTSLHYTTLHCPTLHYTTLQHMLHITLPYTAPSSWPAAPQLPPLDYRTLLTPTCKVQYTELYCTLQCSVHYSAVHTTVQCAVHCAALHSTAHCNLLPDTVHVRAKLLLFLPRFLWTWTLHPMATEWGAMRISTSLYMYILLCSNRRCGCNWDCLAVVQLQTDWLLVRVTAK